MNRTWLTYALVFLLALSTQLPGQAAEDELAAAVAAGDQVGQALVQVEAIGWKLRKIDPDQVIRVWDLPVQFTSLDSLARVAQSGQLQKLGEKMGEKISLDFADTPVRDVLAFLQSVSGLTIVVDPEVPEPDVLVTLKVNGMPFQSAFEAIVERLAHLHFRIVDGVILVSQIPAWLPSAVVLCDSADSEALRRFAAGLDEKAGVDFADTPIQQVVGFISQAWWPDVQMVADTRSVSENRRDLTFKMPSLPRSQVMGALLRSAGLRVHVVREVLTLSPDSVFLTRAEGDDRPVVKLTPDTFDIGPALVGDPNADRTLAKLGERISLDFADTPVTDAVVFLHDVSGINMMLDPSAVDGEGPAITLKCENMRLGNALDIILDAAAVGYLVRDHGIFISDEQPLGRPATFGWPREEPRAADADQRAELTAKLGDKMSLDFAQTRIEDVIAFLHDVSGINMMLDPVLSSRSYKDSRPITLRTEDLSLRTQLGLIAYLSDLRMFCRHNTLYFTSKEAGEVRQNRDKDRTGAGVIVDPKGYVLTALSTVEQAKEIRVRLPEGKWHDAKVVRLDKEKGTALLKIDAQGLPFAQLAR